MKEMIYSAKRLNPPERIAEGEHKGFTYYVLNLGTHPCAYVDVTDTTLHGKDYDDIDIECHCGLTYASVAMSTNTSQLSLRKNGRTLVKGSAMNILNGERRCGMRAMDRERRITTPKQKFLKSGRKNQIEGIK